MSGMKARVIKTREPALKKLMFRCKYQSLPTSRSDTGLANRRKPG
jgi:hypothetical protein